MTRLNLVPVTELTDQHLFSEWREIKMVPKALRRSIAARGVAAVYASVPTEFTLGRGHVSFFYNKGLYLAERYDQLTQELVRRAVYNFNRRAQLDPEGVYDALGMRFSSAYEPTDEALRLVRERIANRIAARPSWYRYYGNRM